MFIATSCLNNLAPLRAKHILAGHVKRSAPNGAAGAHRAPSGYKHLALTGRSINAQSVALPN